jgi:murein DD-endopeptidase MepM/ murein hydrolase activator NlpD
MSRRLDALRARRVELDAWLYSWGIFSVCPVDAPRYIHNDFGEIVSVEGVEPHVHMGSDIEAPTWTPIRAPFDGYAWGSYSPLGGYQVRVRGDRGYVFNAHLIGYGDLGWVEAGTIIGYVGDTGDSTAPHDHFEWHPWGGGAVDPYSLLTLSCD